MLPADRVVQGVRHRDLAGPFRVAWESTVREGTRSSTEPPGLTRRSARAVRLAACRCRTSRSAPAGAGREPGHDLAAGAPLVLAQLLHVPSEITSSLARENCDESIAESARSFESDPLDRDTLAVDRGLGVGRRWCAICPLSRR